MVARLRPHLTWCALCAILLATPNPLLAGGTPDPGTSPLAADGGDADALPDNENQLLGFLGPDRGFGFGDYVNDANEGLQSVLGSGASFDFYIEVPPGQALLTVEIFDADLGAGEVGGGTELHDQANNTPSWTATSRYELVDPNGTSVATVDLPGQDCDAVTVGQQTACDNTWSDLGLFTIATPDPGHWRFRVSSPASGTTDEDDNNSFGVRAHDGDPSAGGTEYRVYADSYVGIGQVYAADAIADPGFSRTHDFFPWVTAYCLFDSNDWDTDSNGDESILYVPPRPPAGTPMTFPFIPDGDNALWAQDIIDGFLTEQDATNYGLWSLRWVTGEFNFITYYNANAVAADPSNAGAGPGNGAEPNQQPEPEALRLYLPADGSRFFGERGGADDVIVAPEQVWLGQSWELLPGEPSVAVGITSRIRVTITLNNPTDLPIQLSPTTGGSEVVEATLPDNMGQTEYVTGSATVTNPSVAGSADTDVTGSGPWTITYAPGVVDPGVTAVMTYDVDVTPTTLGGINLTGIGNTGTLGDYVDGTCANIAGGPPLCLPGALPRATPQVGPLCRLSVNVTSAPAIGVAKNLSAGPNDNGDGTFTVEFTFIVENLGNEALDPVEVQENLQNLFGPTATYTIDSLTASIQSGGGVFSPNASFDGMGDNNLLSAFSNLAPGAVGEIVLQVTFDPNEEAGPYINQVFAVGMTGGGGTVFDPSDDGTDPDTDGDGTANETGDPLTCPSTDPADDCENDPTIFDIPANPSIGIAKENQGVVDNGDGTFTVDLQMTVENLGNVNLRTLRVSDSLAAAFPAPATFTVDSATASGPAGSGISASPTYDGDGDTLLVDGGTLGPAETATIDLIVTFNPQDGPCDFANSARASASSPQTGGGEAASDFSDNGTNPDPDGDGDANESPGPPTCPSTNPADNCENDPTPITAPGTATLGLAKRVVSQSVQPGGTVVVDFEVVVENLGSVFLDQVDVTDDLTATFPPPVTFTVTSGPTASGTLTANGAYTGNPGSDQLLVPGSSTLDVGASETITFQVEFDPNGTPGPFFNQASGTAQSCVGSTSDDSDNGTDPDPDGDGDPTEDPGPPTCPSMDPGDNCEDDPTPVSIAEDPAIVITKTSGTVTETPGQPGQFDVTFTLEVENTGDVDLSNLQVTDPLDAAFAPATVVSAGASCTSGSCGTVVLDYTGPSDPTLLDASQSSLASGGTVTLTLDVTFEPNGAPGPFVNTAIAQGESPLGATPTDTDTDTVDVPVAAGLDLTKTTTSVADNMDGTFTASFEIAIENQSNVQLLDVSIIDDLGLTFPAPATVLSVTPPVASGTLTANPAYDGTTDPELLVPAASTLDVGASETVTFSVTFDPGGQTSFTNTADGSAQTPQGGDVEATDSSTFSVTGVVVDLDVEKSLVALVDEGDGTFTASFEISLENLGNVDLVNVALVDDLGATFAAPASVIAVSTPIATGTLTANPAYDGTTDTDLLVPATSTLPVGATETVSFDVTFDPAGEESFVNLAEASAEDSTGTPVEATDTETVTVGVLDPLEIPTLGEWGLIGLATLLGLAGAAFVRRRRDPSTV